jgi:hypothetical protein
MVKEVVDLVEKLIRISEEIHRSGNKNTDKMNEDKIEFDNLIRTLDDIVYKTYGLTEEEIRIIKEII